MGHKMISSMYSTALAMSSACDEVTKLYGYVPWPVQQQALGAFDDSLVWVADYWQSKCVCGFDYLSDMCMCPLNMCVCNVLSIQCK